MANEKLIINDEEVELTSGSKIALTYQVNDLADVKDRQSSFTNQFTCEDTDTNRKIFGAANDPMSDSVVPYKSNSAKIVADGVQIVPNGIAYLQSSDRRFSVVVYDGLKKLFELIGDKSIRELDYSSDNPTWDRIDINVLWGQINSPYMYAVVNDGLNISNADRNIEMSTLFPMITVSSIIEKIFQSAGYSFESESFAFNEQFYYLAIPFTNSVPVTTTPNITIATPDTMKAKIYTSATVLNRVRGIYSSGSWYYNALFAMNNIRFNALVIPDSWSNPSSNFNSTTGVWTATRSSKTIVKSRFTIKVDTSVNLSGVPLFTQESFAIFAHLQYYSGMTNAGSPIVTKKFSYGDVYHYGGQYYIDIYFNEEIELTVGSLINIRVDCLTYNYDDTAIAPNAFVMIDVHPMTGERGYFSAEFAINGFGGVWDIAKNLPDIKQREFVKAIANRYCHLIDVDNLNKVVRFIPMTRLESNKAIADDWSSYLAEDHRDVETHFHPTDYARSSWLKYKKDENVTEGFGDYAINIADDSLQEKKTVIEMPFAASDSSQVLQGFQVANVKRYKDRDPDKSITPEPRILFVQKRIVTTGGLFHLVNAGTTTDIPTNTLMTAHFADPDSSRNDRDLRFENIVNTDYRTIKSMFTKYRKIRPKVIIPASVISNPKPEIPKYFAQFGAYFYLNKIENWRNGEVCVAELIRL